MHTVNKFRGSPLKSAGAQQRPAPDTHNQVSMATTFISPINEYTVTVMASGIVNSATHALPIWKDQTADCVSWHRAGLSHAWITITHGTIKGSKPDSFSNLAVAYHTVHLVQRSLEVVQETCSYAEFITTKLAFQLKKSLSCELRSLLVHFLELYGLVFMLIK